MLLFGERNTKTDVLNKSDSNKVSELLRYLDQLQTDSQRDRQQNWADVLRAGVRDGDILLTEKGTAERLSRAFSDWVRTEELKAWYGEHDKGSLFQGTSVTSLTAPSIYDEPLDFTGIAMLEDVIADAYIQNHHLHEPKIRSAIVENVDRWMGEGAFYGVAIASKVISQAFGFTVLADDIVIDVDGVTVDPHQITTHEEAIRQRYFEECINRIDCFDGLDLEQREFESALVLADISKPKFKKYENNLIIAPVRCNEIAAVLSRRITKLILEKSNGRITPRSLLVTIFDTDTPYTYHQINGYFGRSDAPILPGLTILGISGSIDAFRWLYAYRVGLVAQKAMKGSLYSEATREFIPFTFFGVLVERDSEILLDLDNLDLLRYRGQVSPYIEYRYFITKLDKLLSATATRDLTQEIDELI